MKTLQKFLNYRLRTTDFLSREFVISSWSYIFIFHLTFAFSEKRLFHYVPWALWIHRHRSTLKISICRYHYRRHNHHDHYHDCWYDTWWSLHATVSSGLSRECVILRLLAEFYVDYLIFSLHTFWQIWQPWQRGSARPLSRPIYLWDRQGTFRKSILCQTFSLELMSRRLALFFTLRPY